MKTIPDKLILAVARYYHGRDAEANFHARVALETVNRYVRGSSQWVSGEAPTWDKMAALKVIDDVVKPLKISVQSSAGTFWFHKMVGKRLICIQVNESNYLDGGTRTVQIKRDGKWVDVKPRKKKEPQVSVTE